MEKLQKFKLRFPLIINTVFALVFFAHSTMIGYGIMYPDEPTTKFYRKKFSDLDLFPLNFKICVKELTNPKDRYSKFGYNDIWKFYKGTDGDEVNGMEENMNNNGTWVGWAGHTKINSTISNAEGKIEKHPVPEFLAHRSPRSPRCRVSVCPYGILFRRTLKRQEASMPDCSLLSFYFRS